MIDFTILLYGTGIIILSAVIKGILDRRVAKRFEIWDGGNPKKGTVVLVVALTLTVGLSSIVVPRLQKQNQIVTAAQPTPTLPSDERDSRKTPHQEEPSGDLSKKSVQRDNIRKGNKADTALKQTIMNAHNSLGRETKTQAPRTANVFNEKDAVAAVKRQDAIKRLEDVVKVFEVSAGLDSDIFVQAGDSVIVTAFGQIVQDKMGIGDVLKRSSKGPEDDYVTTTVSTLFVPYGPEGLEMFPEMFKWQPRYKFGALLIGTGNNGWFHCGTSFKKQATRNGFLRFRINDLYKGIDEQEFIVEVKVLRKQS